MKRDLNDVKKDWKDFTMWNEKEDNTKKSRQQRCCSQLIDTPKKELRVSEKKYSNEKYNWRKNLWTEKISLNVSWSDSF